MKIDSDTLKKQYVTHLDALRRELAEGYMLVERETRQLENVREQLRRIEGAKTLAEQLLNGVLATEKQQAEAEAAAKNVASQNNDIPTPKEPRSHVPVATRK